MLVHLRTLTSFNQQPNCTVVVTTHVSDGFFDGGLGAVAVTVRDYNTGIITLSNNPLVLQPYKSSLSKINVQVTQSATILV